MTNLHKKTLTQLVYYDWKLINGISTFSSKIINLIFNLESIIFINNTYYLFFFNSFNNSYLGSYLIQN